jgi:hypothetical protein
MGFRACCNTYLPPATWADGAIESLTGRDSIDADATVLLNLLWRNFGEV